MDIVEPVTDVAARSQAIRELLNVRDGISILPGLTHDDVRDVIESMCML